MKVKIYPYFSIRLPEKAKVVFFLLSQLKEYVLGLSITYLY